MRAKADIKAQRNAERREILYEDAANALGYLTISVWLVLTIRFTTDGTAWHLLLAIFTGAMAARSVTRKVRWG